MLPEVYESLTFSAAPDYFLKAAMNDDFSQFWDKWQNKGKDKMNTVITQLYERKSVRVFEEKEISQEEIPNGTLKTAYWKKNHRDMICQTSEEIRKNFKLD